MGKNRKKKHKNKPHVLPWAKFIKKYCKKCFICYGTINAHYCYKRYVRCPDSWVNDVFPKINKLNRIITHFDTPGAIYEFEEVFCTNCNYGIKNHLQACNILDTCFNMFKKQVDNSFDASYDKTFSNKKKERPKPVFFTSNPEKWDKIIQKVLYNNAEST